MQVAVTVCNVCQDVTRPTHQYAIELGSKRVTPDLCDEHSAPLDELLGYVEQAQGAREKPQARRTATKKATGSSSTPKRRQSRQRGVQVVTLEDIEKRKGSGRETEGSNAVE